MRVAGGCRRRLRGGERGGRGRGRHRGGGRAPETTCDSDSFVRKVHSGRGADHPVLQLLAAARARVADMTRFTYVHRNLEMMMIWK